MPSCLGIINIKMIKRMGMKNVFRILILLANVSISLLKFLLTSLNCFLVCSTKI